MNPEDRRGGPRVPMAVVPIHPCRACPLNTVLDATLPATKAADAARPDAAEDRDDA
jgi:hypothetical protein